MGVTAKPVIEFWVYCGVKGKTLGLGMGTEQLHQPVNGCVKIEASHFNGKAARFDLADVQDVVDEGAEYRNRMPKKLNKLSLLSRQVGSFE